MLKKWCKSLTKIKAIIFDLDGVLIHPDFSIFKQARDEIISYLRKIGITVTPESPFFKKVFDALMKKFDERQVWEHYSRISRIAEKYEMKALNYAEVESNAKEVLEKLKRNGFQLGLFSLSGKQYVKEALRMLDCLELFDVIVTRDDKVKPKPYPDGILLICELLGICPHESIFIGDTKIDVEAAIKANAIPILIMKTEANIFPEQFTQNVIILRRIDSKQMLFLLQNNGFFSVSKRFTKKF